MAFKFYLIGIISVIVGLSSSAEADYLLGPQDKVRLMVYEWRSSRAEVFAWSALNSEFTVSASGMLSLPLVGSVKALSLTVEQLGKDIEDQLQKKMGLVVRPTASVEISGFRPVYVTGDVANPGEFPYRPDLTLLKAISLAGGLYRPTAANFNSLERDATLARGDLRAVSVERLSLTAKHARLQAEALNIPQIAFPEELKRSNSDPDVANALREEEMIFESRRNSLRSKIESLNSAKILLAKEIVALIAKDGSIGRQLALAVSDRENVTSLASRGLVVSSRQISTEQAVAQMESARLDVGIARVRAEQDQGKLDRDLLELQDQRRAEILLEMRQVETKINELREKATTSERLAYNAEALSPRREFQDSNEIAAAPTFTIVRSRAGKTEEIDGDVATEIEPGDVVQVTRSTTTKRNSSLTGRKTVLSTELLSSKVQAP